MIRILHIDDSKTVHAFVGECLKGLDIELTHAYNGKEGFEAAKKMGDQLDLILLDWEMPVMTGPETFAALKLIGFKKPVIMLTSKNNFEDITKMITEGVAEYVMKPFTTEILIGKIESVLGGEINKYDAAA